MQFVGRKQNQPERPEQEDEDRVIPRPKAEVVEWLPVVVQASAEYTDEDVEEVHGHDYHMVLVAAVAYTAIWRKNSAM